MNQRTENREQRIEKSRRTVRCSLFSFRAVRTKGFTLIETMAAIALLMLAIVAPMSLAAQSLSAAYYSRAQITAFYLAQEGIEIVRGVRDANILTGSASVFTGIPVGTRKGNAPAFTVDALQPITSAIVTCAATCPPLTTNGSTYSYKTSKGWSDTIFTRTIIAYPAVVRGTDELRISVTVTWKQGTYQTRSFTINEDLYNWIST